MATKETLRRLIDAARDRETVELVPHLDEPPAAPDAWSPKDNLAHLSAWRSIAAAELDAVRTGGPAPDVADETDEQNVRIYREHRDLSATTVLEIAVRSWDDLAAALDACSEEVLHRPRLRRPEQEVWQVVPGNTYFHLAQHLDWWHSERGEEAEADDAALWAHDVALTAFREDDRRGIADYNLGCYYASHARAAEAVPLIRRGIELNPGLREVARQDPDLDPIRQVPELAELLE